jgi:hypothetical protein
MSTHPGQVEITFEYARHLGPRFIHGAVQLQFDALQPYSFRSEAQWPSGDDYSSCIRQEVESVLVERLGSLLKVAVVLKSVSFDPLSSSVEGFRRAARVATEAAFSV